MSRAARCHDERVVSPCFFVSDLHGKKARYRRLFDTVEREQPLAIFLGGDLLPHGDFLISSGFLRSFLYPALRNLKQTLGSAYPRFLAIPGNDDAAAAVNEMIGVAQEGLLEFIHGRSIEFCGRNVVGYGCVPPTPFLLKDWERYDVSRYVDPGCVPPDEGYRTVPVELSEIRYSTIARDLEGLTSGLDAATTVLLLHTPPYRTSLDRGAVEGRTVDGVPIDPHLGSIAVRRLIEHWQPSLTLHGHIHEAARLTGSWSDHIGRTPMFTAAHDGPELALIRFDLSRPEEAFRELINVS